MASLPVSLSGFSLVPDLSFDFSRSLALACSAGVFFGRAICSRKRHCHKIKNGGYNNITNTNKVSPTQNTPALQASSRLLEYAKIRTVLQSIIILARPVKFLGRPRMLKRSKARSEVGHVKVARLSLENRFCGIQ